MTSRQESKLNMYTAVLTHCNADPLIPPTVPAFATALAAFAIKHTAIFTTSTAEAAVIGGYAVDKATKRNSLCTQAADVAAAVYAYAVATNDLVLKEKMDISFSELKKLKDELLVQACSNIHADATAIVASLVPYGLTAAVLTSFNTNCTTYLTSVPIPRNAVSTRKAHGAALKQLFKEADAILKSQMDKLINQFKTNHPLFHAAYKHNRIILDPATSATQLIGTITTPSAGGAPDGGSPIPGVSIQVQGTTYITTNQPNGEYKLKIPIPGAYNITFAKPGYTTITILNITITLGQTTVLDMQLIPA